MAGTDPDRALLEAGEAVDDEDGARLERASLALLSYARRLKQEGARA